MKERAWKEREARKLELAIRRHTVRELREKIRAARARRRELLKQVRHHCRAGRVRLRERIKAVKLAERERLKREIQAMREEARGRCRARVDRVRELGGSRVALERERLRAEKALQRETDVIAGRIRKTHAARVSANERRQESDDEVRQNLPDELLGVFEAVKGSIRGGPRISRTERFLHWAEENPEEVVSLQGMHADAATERMIRELEQHERELHRERRGKAA